MNLRLELNDRIGSEVVSQHVLSVFMRKAYPSSMEYWLFRRLFSQQFALATFVCYVMAFGHRTPSKYTIGLNNGQVFVNEVLPSINNSGQIALLDAVPFRLTPNIQTFIGHFGIEGVFAECVRATASIFSQVEKGDMGLSLPLFLRDELATWLLTSPEQSQSQHDGGLLEKEAALFNSIVSFDHDFCSSRIKPNIELFNKRVLTLACVREAELAAQSMNNRAAIGDNQLSVPANQAILDLISCATNPQKLALMDPVWQPWF